MLWETVESFVAMFRDGGIRENGWPAAVQFTRRRVG